LPHRFPEFKGLSTDRCWNGYKRELGFPTLGLGYSEEVRNNHTENIILIKMA
jgi:hypothetical protein